MNSSQTGAQRPWRLRLLVLLLLCLLSVFWFGSGAAELLVSVARYVGARWTDGTDLRVEAISLAGPGFSPGDQEAGIHLSMSPARARLFVQEFAGPWRFLLPPGVLREGLSIRGCWVIRQPAGSSPLIMPVLVTLDGRGAYPTLRCRFPRSRLNAVARTEGFLGSRKRRKEYSLGHYQLRNEYQFQSLRIESEPPDRVPVTHRRLHAYVSGRVRYWLDENIISARSTADVRPSHLRMDIDVERFLDGIGIRYRWQFIAFDADFNNTMPMLDGLLTDRLRDSLESTLNRERSVERMARRRLPLWTPMDLALDLELIDG